MTTTSLAGRLLLAMPGMGDARFDRTAIAMCAHDGNGALGLIVNRAYETLTVRQLMEQLEIDPGVTPENRLVHMGGPVETGRGFILHSVDYADEATLTVDGLWG